MRRRWPPERSEIAASPSSEARAPATALREILKKTWPQSPIDPISVPLAVSAILGCCHVVRLFDQEAHPPEAYRSIVDLFLADFAGGDLVVDGSLVDQFLLSLSLLVCVRHRPRIDLVRAE
jgi:hypothetical protein